MADEAKVGAARAALAGFEWDAADAEGSLRRLKTFATSRAVYAMDYYQRVRIPKKWWAVRLRIVSLVCAGISGILPLLSQIFIDTQGRPVIAPAWASVFLALAAGGVAIDRYFGFSSAWMRFMSSELRLNRAMDRFELDWESVRAGIVEPETQRSESMMLLARSFIAEVADVTGEETQQWISEFRETIRQLDQRTGRTAVRAGDIDEGE